MRSSTDLPYERKGNSKTKLIIMGAVLIIIVLIASLRGLANFYIGYEWFKNIHLSQVWSGILGAKVGLFLVFLIIFFLFLWGNLAIGDRLTPSFSLSSVEDELVKRYRETIGRHKRLSHIIVAAVFSFLAAGGASSQWRNWILFTHSVPFGIKDPLFHLDVSFFVFKLPFLSFVLNWLLFAVIFATLVLVIFYYLNGGIRLQSRPKVTPYVKAHISVLLAFLALIKAGGYFLQRFQLDFSHLGVVEGAGYASVKAQLPALEILILVSLTSMVLFLVNIRRQGWTLPVLGVGLWALVAIVVGGIYPSLVEKFKVQPAQETLEAPYIARNIKATRHAYGINNIVLHNFSASSSLSPAQLAANVGNLNNITLWRPTIAKQSYQKLQDLRSYYTFHSLTLGQYSIGGKKVPAILSVRELNQSNLPSNSWVSRHLVYTHGYGAVLAPANKVNPSGNPSFSMKDIPPTSIPSSPSITQPDVYYGLGSNSSNYVVVHSAQQELDYQGPNGTNHYSSYNSTGGIQLNSFIKRAAFALHYGNINLVVSDLLTPKSRLMMYRNVVLRAKSAAPFLRFGSHPYPVLAKGKLYWVLNGYTTTSHYPYSQQANTSQLNPSSGLNRPLNYVSNSVRVIVNAYSGSMKFYVVNPHDPIIQAYQKAFPNLFRPSSQINPAIKKHILYPKDLFTLQSQMFGRYHITNPSGFYNAGNAWQVSQDAGTGSPSAALQTTNTTNAQGLVVGTGVKSMPPLYEMMQLPGANKQTFNLLSSFIPLSQGSQQQNLTAFLTAQSSGSHFGKLQAFITPPGQLIDGPVLVDSRILADSKISRDISLLNQQGSQVELGNVMTVPMGNSLLYVRDLYVQSSRNPLPEFRKIIIVFGTHAAMGDTLSQALAGVFGSSPSVGNPTSSSPTTPASSAIVNQLLTQAQSFYTQAQAALKAGNLGLYQSDISKMGSLISQAQHQLNPTSSPTTNSSTTTTSVASQNKASSKASSA